MQKFYIQFLAEISYACRLASEGDYRRSRQALHDALASTKCIDGSIVLTHGGVLEVLDTWKAITILQGIIAAAEASSFVVKVGFPP